MQPDRSAVRDYLVGLQRRITDTIAEVDGGATFKADAWQRPGGGGGESRILQDGALLEQGGVGFSHVMGSGLPPSATQQRPELAGASFEAMGVSLVFHPKNPFVPTTHMNVRFFIAEREGHAPVWWFGGGFDLTPYYPFMDDVVHWHSVAREACLPFGDDVYPRYKRWCDEYFYLPHRKEARGIGGIFYDWHDSGDWEADLAFTQDVGRAFLKIYPEIVRRNFESAWTAADRVPTQKIDSSSSALRTLPRVSLRRGDELRIEGTPNGGESAALDYIEIR